MPRRFVRIQHAPYQRGRHASHRFYVVVCQELIPRSGKIDFILRNSAQSICIQNPIPIEEYAINLMALYHRLSGELICRHRALRGSRGCGHKEGKFHGEFLSDIQIALNDKRKAPAGLGLFKYCIIGRRPLIIPGKCHQEMKQTHEYIVERNV